MIFVIRCVFVCMKLSSKLELIYILYTWFCCLIFYINLWRNYYRLLWYRYYYRKIGMLAIKGRCNFWLGKIHSRKLGLTIFFNKRISYEFSLHNSNYIESKIDYFLLISFLSSFTSSFVIVLYNCFLCK